MVLSPELDEPGVTGITDRLGQFIGQRGGAITKQETWGVRKLAYPIRRYKEGNYVLTEFTSEAGTTQELESSLRIWSEVLRYFVVKK